MTSCRLHGRYCRSDSEPVTSSRRDGPARRPARRHHSRLIRRPCACACPSVGAQAEGLLADEPVVGGQVDRAVDAGQACELGRNLPSAVRESAPP
jgi:hypothetical protein